MNSQRKFSLDINELSLWLLIGYIELMKEASSSRLVSALTGT